MEGAIPTWLEILENLGRAKLKTENKFKDWKGKEWGEQEDEQCHSCLYIPRGIGDMSKEDYQSKRASKSSTYPGAPDVSIRIFNHPTTISPSISGAALDDLIQQPC